MRTKFRLVLTGHWLSLLGSAVFSTFVLWFVNTHVGLQDASWSLMAVQFLPALIALPFTMIIIDKVSKHTLVIAADLWRCGVTLVAAVISFVTTSTTVAVVTLLIAVVLIRFADALYTPAVRSGLGSAIQRGSTHSPHFYLTLTSLSVGLFMPLLVPVSLALSIAGVLLINSITYAFSAFAFINVGKELFPSAPSAADTAHRRWYSELKSGLQVATRNPVLLRIVVALPFIDFAMSARMMIYPTIARNQMVLGEGIYFGLLVGATALARIAGVYFYRHVFQYKRDGILIAFNCVLQGLVVLISAFFLHGWMFIVLSCCIALLVGANSLAINELVQTIAPRADVGKYFTFLAFASLLAMPVGPLLVGILASYSVTTILVAVSLPLIISGLLPLTSRQIVGFRQPPREIASA